MRTHRQGLPVHQESQLEVFGNAHHDDLAHPRRRPQAQGQSVGHLRPEPIMVEERHPPVGKLAARRGLGHVVQQRRQRQHLAARQSVGDRLVEDRRDRRAVGRETTGRGPRAAAQPCSTTSSVWPSTSLWWYVALIEAACLLELGDERPSPPQRVQRRECPPCARQAHHSVQLVAQALGALDHSCRRGRAAQAARRRIDRKPELLGQAREIAGSARGRPQNASGPDRAQPPRTPDRHARRGGRSARAHR